MMDVDELIARDVERRKVATTKLRPRTEEYEIDAGNMLLTDPRPLPLGQINEEVLRNIARDNAQLIINAIFELPVEKNKDGVYAVLPAGTTRLPREKPVPKPKPLTRWEEYAKLKGIQNTKKSRMVWDEKTGDYKPRWGYNRIDDIADIPWIEVPKNADPYEDQFEKLKTERKERIAKNEAQRLRNLGAVRPLKGESKDKVDSTTEAPIGVRQEMMRRSLTKAIKIGKKSNASAGVFDGDLPKEPKVRAVSTKRKRQPVVDDGEQARAKAIFNKLAKKNKIMINTATGQTSASATGLDGDNKHKVKKQGKRKNKKKMTKKG